MNTSSYLPTPPGLPLSKFPSSFPQVMAKASKKTQKSNKNDDSSSKTNIEVKCTTKCKRTRRSLPRDTSSQRSSVYRGVTRHRWTGRFEAHLWDKDCWSDAQKKKGRQVYLGAYNDEVTASRAYDLAALKYWGKETVLNFPLSNYEKDLEEMESLSREEYIGSLRRKSSGFSRGVSKYRGVARHHHNGRWEARIGRVLGNKYLYLGTYATQEEAATAYDIAAIEHRGLNAVTNFDLSRYVDLVKPNNNNTCKDQPSPTSNQYEPTSATSSNCSSTITLDENTINQEVDDDICIDVDMLWGDLPSLDCPSTPLLLFNESQSFDPIDNGLCSLVGSQVSSSSNDFGSYQDGFFSDLSSFLCDFDELEDHIGDWNV